MFKVPSPLARRCFLLLLTAALALSAYACGSSGSSPGSSTSTLSSGGGSGTPVATGLATLNWAAPTTNSNGSSLTNLAGYNVYYGTSPRSQSGGYPNKINAGDVTSYTVQGLAPGTYYFAVTAYNAAGVESAYSTEVSKIIP